MRRKFEVEIEYPDGVSAAHGPDALDIAKALKLIATRRGFTAAEVTVHDRTVPPKPPEYAVHTPEEQRRRGLNLERFIQAVQRILYSERGYVYDGQDRDDWNPNKEQGATELGQLCELFDQEGLAPYEVES